MFVVTPIVLLVLGLTLGGTAVVGESQEPEQHKEPVTEQVQTEITPDPRGLAGAEQDSTPEQAGNPVL